MLPGKFQDFIQVSMCLKKCNYPPAHKYSSQVEAFS